MGCSMYTCVIATPNELAIDEDLRNRPLPCHRPQVLLNAGAVIALIQLHVHITHLVSNRMTMPLKGWTSAAF